MLLYQCKCGHEMPLENPTEDTACPMCGRRGNFTEIDSPTEDYCECQSYEGNSHLDGLGKCPGEGHAPYCGDCGLPCNAIPCDSGIGAYEYWGSKGYDSHPYLGSDCCEANVYQDIMLTQEYTEGE